MHLADDFAGLFKHWSLVFADGHDVCIKGSDVCGLADGIAQKSCGNARCEIFLRDFGFDGWISFKARHRDDVHVVSGEFKQLRDLRLDKNRGLSRVDTDGKIIKRDVQNIFVNFGGRAGVIGQSLRIGYHDVNFVEFAGILQADTFAKTANVMTEM